MFYEGHLPAFTVSSFLRRGLGAPAVNAAFEGLFARGIDPEDEGTAVPRSGASTVWPARDEVRAFGRAVDAAVLDALSGARFDARPRREALFTALEHELMHQETLLYMWRRLPHAQKRRPAGLACERGDRPRHHALAVPAGVATLGAPRESVRFGWDNEFGELRVTVPAFEIDAQVVEMGAGAGFATRERRIDADARFALTLFAR